MPTEGVLHRSVMVEEAIALLAPERGGVLIDGTLGMGGHTERWLEAVDAAGATGRVIGLDRDAESIPLAKQRLARFGDRIEYLHADYRDVATICRDRGIESVSGILVDLGISSYQLETLERGFSFRQGEGRGEAADASEILLDMRMDRSQGETAAELIARLSEPQLAELLWSYGEEPASRRIARRIVEQRSRSPIRTTAQLADLVIRAVHQKGHWRIHPATRTFQALRIAVNRELEGLSTFVGEAVDLLAPEGRLVVITFHSLEDRLIKQALRFQAGQCQCPPHAPTCQCRAVRRVELLTRKALCPGPEEIALNPRARSARLRACRKLSLPDPSGQGGREDEHAAPPSGGGHG
ncbi:MAG: 16S rRNA (cytosine(1402)-N(4))-methyltransferase RsmH [Blastocatellia bacterium]